MVSIYDVKPGFQRALRPGLRVLRAAGVTPNGLTLFALLGSVAVGALLHHTRGHGSWLLLLPGWLLVRMALNALDGMMAREYSMATPAGAVLNEVGDVISDVALYIPLASVLPDASVAALAFVIVSTLTEFCGVLVQALGGARRYDGPMGKSDRAFWVGLWAAVGVAWPPALDHAVVFLWIATLLGAVTCAHRLRPVARGVS